MIGIHSTQKGIHTPVDTEMETVDLTALIDVLFILLVFFLLTSGSPQFFTEVQLSKSEDFVENTEIAPNSVFIEMYMDGNHWQVNGKKFSDYSKFKRSLLNLYHSNKKPVFVLAPERNLPVEHLIKLINFLSKNKITDVHIINKWVQ